MIGYKCFIFAEGTICRLKIIKNFNLYEVRKGAFKVSLNGMDNSELSRNFFIFILS